VKQAVRRGRVLAKQSLVLGSTCAALLAFACGGGSDGSTPASADSNVALPDEPEPTPSGETPDVTPPDDVAPETPPAPDPSEPEPAEPDPTAPVDPVEPPRRCDSSISFDDLYSDVAIDLNAEGDDGLFLRYVSLANRLNQGICSEDLADDRFAVFKAVNSLSTEVQMHAPEPIDGESTLYRIDLREIGWDRPTVVDGVEFADKWEALIAASPYAVQFEGDDAEEAQLDSGTSVPVLFADAFIDAAMVDNLYYAMIEIGESEDELLEQLGIDEEEDVVLRVGTSNSRLSRQDALAERFDQVGFQGYYWSRYDLAEDTGGQSVFADPLEFQADSVGVVFSLKNGLNAYALFDGTGARITDTDVIVDATQRDGRVRNGVSCSQCHAAGVLPMSDEVREYVAQNRRDFDADTLGELEDTFLEQSEIDELIQNDGALYSQALARAGIEVTGSDPIAATYVRFDGDVTLPAAAGELGLTPAELERDLRFVAGRVDGSLSSLLTQGLRREQFDALYLATLCVMQAVGDNRPLAADCAAVGQ